MPFRHVGKSIGALARSRIWMPEGTTSSGSRVCRFHHKRVIGEPPRTRTEINRIKSPGSSTVGRATQDWGDWRVPTPRPPGSRPGAPPLSYSHHWSYLPLHPPPRPRPYDPWRPGCPKVATSRRGALFRWFPMGNGHRAPARLRLRLGFQGTRSFDPRPVKGGRRACSSIEARPGMAAPLRQSELLESIRVAACPPRSNRFHCDPPFRRGDNEKPPVNLSAYRGFLESGNPLHL